LFAARGKSGAARLARARRSGRQQRPRCSRGQPSPERAYTRNEGDGYRRASRTHTVEPLEDPVPRELPDESPEREEPAEPPREPGEGTGVRRRPHGSAGLRRADRRLARLVRRRSRGRPSALLDRLPHALARRVRKLTWRLSESALIERSGARSEPLGDELDRVDISAAVVEGAAKLVVEGAAVAVAEAAGISDLVAKVDRHLVHEPEDAAACRPCETNGVGVELAERVERQA
jgi:hypothetical protein